jgi:PPK2 family polyphosphate:nucleotide phosphotransferase
VSQAPNLRDALRVVPGARLDLAKIDPGDTHGIDRERGKPMVDGLLDRLTELQERLWAEQQRSVLVVLQGIDAAGKDGTIRKVMTAFNPQGCPVSSFKVPSTEELAHDFLWRIHKRVPARGEVGIFNRSQYEDVLVVRVHQLVPKEVWHARYDQIVAFEDHLSANRTTVVKFFLYIDKDEQRERFQARYDDPTKRWKFALGDLEERKFWDDYIAAYEDALSKTSTKAAPWYVIPANHKWFRDLAVASILASTLEELNLQYPPGEDLPANLVID